MESLYELGGAASVSEALAKVEEKMKGLFDDDIDNERILAGELRWKNTARWARAALVNRGLVKRGSPRGIWELTADGIAEAKAIATN